MQDRLKTNCGRKKTVQVPRNVGIIAQKMRQTPTLSIRRLHLGTGLRRSSVQKMLRKTLKMKVYRRPLVQALLPGDIDNRVKWAEDFLEAAERDLPTLTTSCGWMKQSSIWMDMLTGIML